MSDTRPPKRSEPSPSGAGTDDTGGLSPPPPARRLLAVVAKSFAGSRESVAADARRTLRDAYGDMTSLFASGKDEDGVASLEALLMGKLDGVHDRFLSERCHAPAEDASPSSAPMTRLEKMLERQQIFQVLEAVEAIVRSLEREEREFDEAEASDKTSAREAIKLAKGTRVSPDSGKKRRVLPAESIGYHSHKLKLEYHQSLSRELEEIEQENTALEKELEGKWDEWKSSVEGVKAALETMEAGASERR